MRIRESRSKTSSVKRAIWRAGWSKPRSASRASHSGDSVFHGGAVKKYRAPLLGVEEIDYHPNGLHAARTGRLANAEKNHRQIARTLKMRGGHFSFLPFPKRRNASEGRGEWSPARTNKNTVTRATGGRPRPPFGERVGMRGAWRLRKPTRGGHCGPPGPPGGGPPGPPAGGDPPGPPLGGGPPGPRPEPTPCGPAGRIARIPRCCMWHALHEFLS